MGSADSSVHEVGPTYVRWEVRPQVWDKADEEAAGVGWGVVEVEAKRRHCGGLSYALPDRRPQLWQAHTVRGDDERLRVPGLPAVPEAARCPPPGGLGRSRLPCGIVRRIVET